MRGRVDSQPTTQSTNLTEETIRFTGSLELRDVPISLSPWQHATFKWEGLTHGNDTFQSLCIARRNIS